MIQLDENTTMSVPRHLSTSIARSSSEIRAAQALRYQIFAEEMGAHLQTSEPGIDADRFDEWCDHLLIHDNRTGEVVGTYRLLPPHRARELGECYSESEFDLSRLQHIRNQTVEVGRSCVHPDYRTGSTIALLWGGLIEYMQQNHYQYLMGCASLSMADGGHNAASLYRQLAEKYLSPAEWRVFPHHPLPLAALDQTRKVATPPLIKGYLRAGSMVCGAPAWDPDFNTADFLILQDMDHLDARLARHFKN